MKTNILILSASLLALLPATADYREWTNAEGHSAQLELVEVKGGQGEKIGVFRMKNGRKVDIKASELSEEHAKDLDSWKMPAQAVESVFDEFFDGGLVILKDGKFVPLEEYVGPQKYYLFYYTASWCPPCRAFTPKLVDWYNKHKNANFELVLVTADRGKDKMEAYAKDKKMPWPQIEFGQARKFRSQHPHGVRGIPSLILCDLEGKILGNYRSRLDEVVDMIKE